MEAYIKNKVTNEIENFVSWYVESMKTFTVFSRLMRVKAREE